MQRQHAGIVANRRDHCREEPDRVLRTQRHAGMEAQFGRGSGDGAACKVAGGWAVGEARCIAPQPERIAIGDLFARRRRDLLALTIEQVRNPYPDLGEALHHSLVGATGKAMNQDCALAESDAERRRAVGMGGTAAHASDTRPGASQRLDDLAGAVFER